MAANDVRKYANLFVDGRGHAGQLDELNTPKLVQKVEEWRAGGMNAPIDLPMGHEKLEADFSLIKYDADVLSLFGVRRGATGVAFVIREALESHDGTVTPVIHTMRGFIRELDPGTSKSGDKPTLKATLSLQYYRLQHGNRVVQEIDVVNMIHIVDGVDLLAEQRAALGI